MRFTLCANSAQREASVAVMMMMMMMTAMVINCARWERHKTLRSIDKRVYNYSASALNGPQYMDN